MQAERVHGLALGCVLLTHACFAPSARAQSVEVAAPPTAFAGEPFRVEVRISDFREADAPLFPELPNAEVRSLPGTRESLQQSISAGRIVESRSRTLYYEVTAMQPGVLDLPPVTVRADGRVLRSRPVRVAVRPNDVSDLVSARVEVDADRLWVGQTVTARLVIHLRAAEIGRRYVSDEFMLRFIDPAGLQPFTLPAKAARQVEARDADGERHWYYDYVCTATHVVQKPGPLDLSTEIAIDYPVAFEEDFWTGQPRPSRARRLRLRPQLPALQAEPLPLDGRPRNFSGAVGRFEITCRASPTTVRVGDPIQLEIEISGDGPPEAVSPPALDSDPRLNESFRVPREVLTGTPVGRGKRFTQTIRAKSADVRAVPPIEYAYFDPSAGRFEVARSAPVPLTVTAADRLDAGELTEIRGAAPPEAPVTPTDALLGPETRESELLRRWRPVPLWECAAAVAAPACLVGAFWIQTAAARRRRADAAGRRRRAALRHARQRLRAARGLEPAACAHQVRGALGAYLADRTDEPAARFDGAASTQWLRDRGLDADLVAAWADVIDRCERAAFARSASDADGALVADALACLARLERVKL